MSLLFFIRKNSSQLSQPSTSNWSNDWKTKHNKIYKIKCKRLSIKMHLICVVIVEFTLTNEHTKQARRPRKSFGIVSKDIFHELIWLQLSPNSNCKYVLSQILFSYGEWFDRNKSVRMATIECRQKQKWLHICQVIWHWNRNRMFLKYKICTRFKVWTFNQFEIDFCQEVK